MKVVYDISSLGLNPSQANSKRGVFRAVERLASALQESAECELFLCASASFRQLRLARSHAEQDVQLRSPPFIAPGSELLSSIAFNLDERLSSMGASSNISRCRKILRRVLLHTMQLAEHFHTYGETGLPETGIFHSPFYELPSPRRLPTRLKRFLTVYDLIPILAPQFVKYERKPYLQRILRSIKPNDWVLCISQSTKNELCEYLNFDPNRAFVTPLAAAPALFYPCLDQHRIKAALTRYGINQDPYILSVTSLEPRKNIEHSIRCFTRLVREQHLDDLQFVLVGAKAWDYKSILATIAECGSIKDRIVLTGHVADQDLAALYSGALAFVFLSFYEGFGLPPLEAMQCGTPVITSNTSSLPEVVGNAGITLNPKDEDGLCSSLLALYEDLSLRKSMSLKSIEQAANFSWQKCAKDTIGAYRIALSS